MRGGLLIDTPYWENGFQGGLWLAVRVLRRRGGGMSGVVFRGCIEMARDGAEGKEEGGEDNLDAVARLDHHVGECVADSQS